MLAQSGIQRFIFIDNDKIDATNLGRQALYFISDIGRYKADVLAQRICEVNPKIDVTDYKLEIHSESDLNCLHLSPDIVVNCADYPDEYSTGRIVTNCFLPLNVPMINGIGYRGSIVSLGLTTIPGKSICWNCARVKFDTIATEYNRIPTGDYKPEAGITAPIATFIASIHAQEVINVLCDDLTPILINRAGAIDFRSLTIKWNPLLDLKKCAICKEIING